MIDIKNKKYRLRSGKEVRLLCDDAPGVYPVIGYLLRDGAVYTWTSEGKFIKGDTDDDPADLVEVSPYEDFEIDEPVMVRGPGINWVRGYFAGIDSDGDPCAWRHGRTSWTEGYKMVWCECRRPTEEELKCRS